MKRLGESELMLAGNWLEYPVAPLEWSEVFGNSGPVELEVGPGKGLFLASVAGAHPGVNYLGVETSRKYANWAACRVAGMGLGNVRICVGDGGRLLGEFVKAGTLRAVHLYFPDPWWKRRHRKRRVFCAGFVRAAARAILSGGRLELATDVEEYFHVMIRTMGESRYFSRVEGVGAGLVEGEEVYLTNFERKYRMEGREIYRAVFLRNGEGFVEEEGGSGLVE